VTLSLASNELGPDGAKHLAVALKVGHLYESVGSANRLCYIQEATFLSCEDGRKFKKPLIGSKCKNCGKSKDHHQQECRCGVCAGAERIFTRLLFSDLQGVVRS
jgi:hypothetical protein